MSAIHLRMVKLKGYRQIVPEHLLFVSAPNDKRIIVNSAVHTNGTVDFCIYNRRCANHHTVRQVPVLAAVSNLHGVSQVILIELRQIFREENIAGADFSFFVLHNSIHGNRIVLDQFMADGENIKLLYA